MSEVIKPEYEKFRVHFDPDDDLTERYHAACNPWLEDMSSREGNQLTPIGYNPEKNPEQSLYASKLEARDPYPKFMPDSIFYAGINHTLRRPLGSEDNKRLMEQLINQPFSSEDQRPLIERLNTYQDEGKNIMVVTSHYSFPELGYVKGLFFQAKHDRPRIGKGGILLSKLMTRQSYDDKPVVEHFRKGANLYFSSPVSTNAEKFGVPKKATDLCNALFLKEYRADMKKGGQQIDAALTGRQVYPIKDEYSHVNLYKVPNVNRSSVELIKYIDCMVFVTLVYSPITNRWEMDISDAVDVQPYSLENSVKIVDSGYKGVAMAIEKITGTETVYYPLAPKLGRLAIDK